MKRELLHSQANQPWGSKGKQMSHLDYLHYVTQRFLHAKLLATVIVQNEWYPLECWSRYLWKGYVSWSTKNIAKNAKINFFKAG